MNIKSLFIALALVLVVGAAAFIGSSKAQDRRYYDRADYRYRGDYRRGGLFGGGGFLGTGVGRDRYDRDRYDDYYRNGYRYYDERRPGVVGGAVDVTEDVVGGAAYTAGSALPWNWGNRDRAQRRYERQQQELDRQARIRDNQ